MAVLSRGQITIVDLNDAKALQCYLQSNQGDSQLYDPSLVTFTPDFSVTNLVITPKIFETGNASTVEAKCSNFKWTIDGTALSASGTSGTIINGGASNATLGCSVSATTGALTISNNIRKDNLALTFDCDYTDNGVTTHLSAQKTIIRSAASTTLFQCRVVAPDGDTFDSSIPSTAKLTAMCYAYHGGTPCPSGSTSYKWYYLDLSNGRWEELGRTTQSIEVTRDDVLNFQTFKCEVTDGEDTSKVSEGIITFRDMTDPYTIDMVAPAGNIIKNGQGEIVIKARVYQGTDLVESEATPEGNRKFHYRWTKYSQNGVAENFYGTTSNVKEGNGLNQLTVTSDEITNKATFFVEIEMIS